MNLYMNAHFWLSHQIDFERLSDPRSIAIELKGAFYVLAKGRDTWAELYYLRDVECLSTHVRLCPSNGEPNAIEITQQFRCVRPIQ